jgi:hypothetical protein
MSTINYPENKVRPGHESNSLTDIYEPIVRKMWDPRHLTTLRAFAVCYKDSSSFTLRQSYRIKAKLSVSLIISPLLSEYSWRSVGIIPPFLSSKSEGSGLDSWWIHYIFFPLYLILPASLWQLLTEMSIRKLSGGSATGSWGWQHHRHLWADCLENVGVSTSHNPLNLHVLLHG